MAQIRNFTSTNDSYFVLDGISYPKVYEAMLDSGYTKDRIKLVGTNRDNSPLVFSTHYLNIKVDGVSFASAQEAISRLNQVVFSKGGGSGGGGTTGDYIPLSGTEEGKPVNGHIAMYNGSSIGTPFQDEVETGALIYFDNLDSVKWKLSASTYKEETGHANMRTYLESSFDAYKLFFPEIESFSGIMVLTTQADATGIEGDLTTKEGIGLFSYLDYSEVLPEIDTIYTQRSYVNKANSYSTEETKTGGTWIDGKPIYTITKLTADPIPTDIEIQFPNIIVGNYTIYKYTKTND